MKVSPIKSYPEWSQDQLNAGRPTKATKELYWVYIGLAGARRRLQTSHMAEKNKEQAVALINALIEEWNEQNSDAA